MLYDQALFATASLETFQITGDSFFKESCTDTLAYVEQKLSSPSGGFYSAEDADSEGVEGKFYLWSKDEILKILEDKDAELICDLYQLEDQGNYLDEATQQKTGENIPHLQQRISEYADKKGFPRGIESPARKNPFTSFRYSGNRIHPQRDDKVLTDWNGLMISAFHGRVRLWEINLTSTGQRRLQIFASLSFANPLDAYSSDGVLDNPAYPLIWMIMLFSPRVCSIFLKPHRNPPIWGMPASSSIFRWIFSKQGTGRVLSDRQGWRRTANPSQRDLRRSHSLWNSIMALNLVRIWQMSQDCTYFECLSRSFRIFRIFKANPSGAENFLQPWLTLFNLHRKWFFAGIQMTQNFKNFPGRSMHASSPLNLFSMLLIPQKIRNWPRSILT